MVGEKDFLEKKRGGLEEISSGMGPESAEESHVGRSKH